MGETVEPLHALAAEAGLQRHWRDVDGVDHVVPDETLVLILDALGHKAASARQIRSSIKELQRIRAQLPALIVADAGQAISLPEGMTLLEIAGEPQAVAPLRPGYYDCLVDGKATRLAVAPEHCPLPPEDTGRPWGTSLQIPSLRGSNASPFGSLAALAEAAEALASRGADAVAINPVHALFPGDGKRFSPYSPSSRRFLNGALADPELAGLAPLPQEEGSALIAWETALPAKLERLRLLFDEMPAEQRAAIIGEPDKDACLHAVFDALYCHFAAEGAAGWQDWPTRYRKPDNKAVASFAAKHADEVEFHLFLQALADQGLAKVQSRAKAAGMSIGLIGDLAVGVDPGGSDCWALGDAMLRGLTIGAPPDPLGPHGQNWSITGFSPEGLRRSSYAPWIAMIRAALAHGGGLRIDHAFGLARLWVIPEGGSPGDGAYLTYPFEDLIRLATLEAHLAGAFIIAEDLGTAPHGFTQAITRHHMLGMRVLWFERAQDNGFIGAQDYDPLAVAMTGTHDTATLAGWWSGNDLDWAAKLGRLPPEVDRAKAEEIRDWDRGLLWSTIAGHHPRPAPDEPHAAVNAAIGHIARTPCPLAIVPVEDLLSLVEQPNLPGTVHEHPNWRRRLDAPLEELLKAPEVQHNVALMRDGRSG